MRRNTAVPSRTIYSPDLLKTRLHKTQRGLHVLPSSCCCSDAHRHYSAACTQGERQVKFCYSWFLSALHPSTTQASFRQVFGNTVLCQIAISNVITNKLKPKQCSGRVALAPESLPWGASLCASHHHHPQKPAASVMLFSGNRSSGFSCACSGTKQGDKEMG